MREEALPAPNVVVANLASGGLALQAVDQVRRALRVAGRGEDSTVVCLEHVQPVGDAGSVVLTWLKRQIQIGTEERGAEPSGGLCRTTVASPSIAASGVRHNQRLSLDYQIWRDGHVAPIEIRLWAPTNSAPVRRRA